MRKLSLGKLLTIIVSSFALVSGPFAYGTTVGGVPVAQSYSATLIPQGTIDDLDGSKFATIMFLSNKANRTSITEMDGTFFLEIAVGIQGLLAAGDITSNIEITGISIKLDDQDSLAAAPSDLFNVLTQEQENALASETSWTSTVSGSLGGTTSSNAAAGTGLHQEDSATFHSTAGHAGLPLYYAASGGAYKAATVKRGSFYDSYQKWLKGPTGDATTHRLGSRAIKGTTPVDFLVNFSNDEAVTIGSGANGNRAAGFSCAAGSNGTSETTCPFYVINTMSAEVDIGADMATSTNVTLAYTQNLEQPTVASGLLVTAGDLTIQTN